MKPLPTPAGPSEEAGGSGVGGFGSGSEPPDLGTAAGWGAAAVQRGPEEGRGPQRAVGRPHGQHQDQRTGAEVDRMPLCV